MFNFSKTLKKINFLLGMIKNKPYIMLKQEIVYLSINSLF